MENVPPSYESAVARNPWQIVAPYIPSAELCALNRVNRGLHGVFAPCLWGNPASHFGTENDRVYVALTRFKRTLKRVRLGVRELTHTLHLPPAQSEIYDGPHPKWLRDVLEQLPNLQSLVVSQLPFFDHMALLSLKPSSNTPQVTRLHTNAAFSLRLLIATGCPNTTSQGLAEALLRFPHLAFLDLSETLAARDKIVLARLHGLPLLQVLKLRRIHLRDDDMGILAEAIGIRVRSLDLQGNNLTDHSVRMLLNSCFQAAGTADGASSNGLPLPSSFTVEDWPSGFIRPDPALLDEFKDESYDERFVRRLTCGIMSRLPYEDMPPSGITHLYIANNNLTVEGLVSLVRSKKLHVLDAGSQKHGTILNRPRSPSSTSTPHPHDDNRLVRIPGVEKLTPNLADFGGAITSLRLHHALITEDAPSKIDEHIPKLELSADASPMPELGGRQMDPPGELDSTPPLYELEPREPVPRFELAGDSVHVVVTPAVGKKPSLSKEGSQSETKRDSIYAPEAVEQAESQDDELPIPDATRIVGKTARTVKSLSTTGLPGGLENPPGALDARQDKPEVQLALIEKKRDELRRSRLERPHGLVPGMMPKLRTLTLTDVPTSAEASKVHRAIIDFINDCASESELATAQARLKPSSARKPGEGQKQQHHHNAREIFALRQVVLEMAPDLLSPSSPSAKKSSFTRNTKSSTEDADSEALWSAAENDFTFFDDDEECGLPSTETDTKVPYPALSEKIVMPSNGLHTDVLPTLQHPAQKATVFDVIHEIASFRKDRKAAHEEAITQGVQHVEGYWPGEVKVIRGHRGGGKNDFYDNQFGKTGVYR